MLEFSLVEGTAEFVAELISGDVAYSHLSAVVAGREVVIETAFVSDQDKTDLSDWLQHIAVPTSLGTATGTSWERRAGRRLTARRG